MSEVIPVAAIDAIIAKGRESKLYISRKYAQGLLEAAAPHMLEEAWDEGHEDGFWNGRLSHGDPEALTGIEHAKATNPYRSQA